VKQIRSTLDALKEGGLTHIDILVLNAGIMPGASSASAQHGSSPG